MFELSKLNYDYGDLAPAISAEIMQLHHSKHHQTYVDKLNAALDKYPELKKLSLEEIIKQAVFLDDDTDANAIFNNGGGHLNHSLFWEWMTPKGQGEPTGDLKELLVGKYGSFQGFVDEFSNKAAGLFGSGWCWLNNDGSIITTSNQDNPVTFDEGKPILGLDVWEHAYYLDYKNVRADYIKAWWEVVNWEKVQEMYESQKNAQA